MSTCQNCKNWTIKKRRLYGDKTEKVYFTVVQGKGHCGILDVYTEAEFGCAKFEDGGGWDHIVTDNIPGEPWQHWKMGPCPGCRGQGSHAVELRPACDRCAGTGNVRYYEDGHIGEERTRRHPKEPDAVAQVDPGTVMQALPSAKSAVV